MHFFVFVLITHSDGDTLQKPNEFMRFLIFGVDLITCGRILTFLL